MMPDMFCYMSVCKSRVINISIQAITASTVAE